MLAPSGILAAEVCIENTSNLNVLFLGSVYVDVKSIGVFFLRASYSKNITASDCFSVAEIIFIPYFVQLLFVIERM